MTIKNDELSALPYTKDYIKVPIQKTKSEYICYLNPKYHRRYTHDSLPTYLLHKLILVNALSEYPPPDYKINSTTLMSEPHDSVSNIGWRASDKWYIVILNTADFQLLQGETNDARKESKN